jgi:hypothetical protein
VWKSALQIVLCGVALFGFLSLYSCGGSGGVEDRPASYKGPQIEFDTDSFDFGECFLGHRKSHLFTLKNVGSEVLNITDVKRECGCLTPEFSTKVIHPGATASMTVVFSPPVIGPISKRIRVYSNDSYANETVITLKALSLGPAHLQPAVLTVDDDVPVGGIEKNLVLRVDDSEAITAVRFITDCGWLRFDPGQALGRSEIGIGLTILPPPAGGRVFEKIVVDITTEDRQGKSRRFALPLPFQVIGDLRPKLFAVPDVLHLGVRPMGTEASKEVVVSGLDSREGPAVIKTEGIDGLHAELDNHLLRIQVSSVSVGRIAGRVVLGWADGGELVIPVLGVFR